MKRNNYRIGHHTIRTMIRVIVVIVALTILALIQVVIHLAPILLIVGLPIAYLAGRNRHNLTCPLPPEGNYRAPIVPLRPEPREPDIGPDVMPSREQLLNDSRSGARPLYPREHGWRSE